MQKINFDPDFDQLIIADPSHCELDGSWRSPKLSDLRRRVFFTQAQSLGLFSKKLDNMPKKFSPVTTLGGLYQGYSDL